MKVSTQFSWDRVRRDALASLVVVLVALPLCMGIAMASGVPVAAGLITGIVGGIVVGTLAGCPLQVSGPAAGLTVIVYQVVQQLGVERLGLVVLVAGALQILAGGLRLGQWFRAVSPAVIHGMLAGIGVLIFASQFHVMIDDKPQGSGLQNLLTIPQAIAKAWSVPVLGTPEQREANAHLLRALGELHRQQVDVAEHVAEHVPQEVREPLSADMWPGFDEIEAEQARILAAVRALFAEYGQSLPRGARRQQRLDAAMSQAETSLIEALLHLDHHDDRVLRRSQTEAVAALENVMAQMKNHEWAAALGVIALVSLVGWKIVAPRKLAFVPAPLVAVVVASALCWGLSLPVLYVEVPDTLTNQVHFPQLLVLREAPWGSVLKAGLLIAVVASAETLLSATAVDAMQNGPRTRYDKELFSQGVGNSICGLLGALPMTGVVVRSTANIQAGARTRLATVLHGLWLLLFVMFLSDVLRMVPTASLAAVLVYTGYKLVDPKHVRELRTYGWGEVLVYLATVVMIVSTDLLTGVLVGLGLAGARLLHTFSHLKADVEPLDNDRGMILRLRGAATFISLPKLAAALDQVPEDKELELDVDRLAFIDHACLELIHNWAKNREANGSIVSIDWEQLHSLVRKTSPLGESEPRPPRKPIAG